VIYRYIFRKAELGVLVSSQSSEVDVGSDIPESDGDSAVDIIIHIDTRGGRSVWALLRHFLVFIGRSI
jgi:hypothetical protein